MSNRAYQPSQIFDAVRAVENGLLATVVAEGLSCSVGSVLRWHRLYRGFSLKDIKHDREVSIEVERLRRGAIRYQAERRAWKVIMRAMDLPLSRRIQLLGQLEGSNLVSTNQAKGMLCMANPKTAFVKFERDDSVILRTMRAHLAANPSHGFILMFHQVLKDKVCGATRAQRIYAEAGLQLYRRNSKRSPGRSKCRLATAPKVNTTWSIDFMHFRLANGAPARTLNVLDDFSRECLLIKGGFGTSASLVAQQLGDLVTRRGVPAEIRCDNGPEFIGRAFSAWAELNGIKVNHIAPFQSYQNGYIERFNRTVRSDLLRWNSFTSLQHFDRVAEAFRYQYNHVRPHKSLGWITPAAFAADNRMH